MKQITRLAFNGLATQIAMLNGVSSAYEKFAVTPSVQQKLESRMQESSGFLKLINIKPVDEKSGEKLGFRKARKLKNEMEELREQTLTELETVLTDEQLAEYQEIQEEIASKIRSRIRASR